MRSPCPKHFVFYQDPQSNITVKKGSQVNITVSKGIYLKVSNFLKDNANTKKIYREIDNIEKERKIIDFGFFKNNLTIRYKNNSKNYSIKEFDQRESNERMAVIALTAISIGKVVDISISNNKVVGVTSKDKEIWISDEEYVYEYPNTIANYFKNNNYSYYVFNCNIYSISEVFNETFISFTSDNISTQYKIKNNHKEKDFLLALFLTADSLDFPVHLEIDKEKNTIIGALITVQ